MLSLWHWLPEARRFMVKVHDQSLIPATAEEVKLQMVSAEVRAVWEGVAGRWRMSDISHSFQWPWVQTLCGVTDGNYLVLWDSSQPSSIYAVLVNTLEGLAEARDVLQ